MTDDNSNKGKQEKVYYDDGNVKITSKRTVLEDKTYVLANISSVTVNTIKQEAKSGNMGCLWVIGVFFAIMGFAMLIDNVVGGGIFFLITAGTACLIAYKFGKGTPGWEKYSVKIGSNAGDSDGLISDDKEYIKKIVNSINDAIIENG